MSPTEKLNLRTQDSHGGSTIGSARVKAVSRTGSELKFHLMDIQLNSGNSFRDVKSIGTSTSNYFGLKLENTKGILKQANKNIFNQFKNVVNLNGQVEKGFSTYN